MPSRSFDVVVTEVALPADNFNIATTDILMVYRINENRIHGPFESLEKIEESAKNLKRTVAFGRYVSGPTVSAHLSTEKGTTLSDIPSLRYSTIGPSGGGKVTTVDHSVENRVKVSLLFR